MSLNTLSPSNEGKDDLSNDNYNKWQNLTHNSIAIPTMSEIQEKSANVVATLIGKINEVKNFVKEKFDNLSNEMLTELTDSALVHIAKKTIASAKKENRTEAESAGIRVAVSSVVVQGAMEEAGMEKSTGSNPILELNQGDTKSDLRDSIITLHEEGVMLPNGEEVAELAARVIETNEKEHGPKVNLSEVIRALNGRELEQTSETIVRPKAEIICDHSHIENQRIDIINKIDRGAMEFRFKLTAPTEAVKALCEKQPIGEDGRPQEVTTPSGATLKRGAIIFEKTSSDTSYKLCDAFVFEKDGITVSIADPSSRDESTKGISHIYNDSNLIRTAMGLVKVEAPSNMEPEAIEQALNEILEKDLGIPGALDEVPDEAEKEYKIARYKWQHGITGELTPEQIEQAEKLEREEVFPGYTTLVEKGKHQEYLAEYGQDVRAIHSLTTGSAKSIYRILTQGLMCTTERYSRGVMRNGMSSITDFDTGGADSVFTRIDNATIRQERTGTIVVFKPEIFDRTDWYSYDGDNYGSTSGEVYSGRLSSEESFSVIAKAPNKYPRNEQMFRTGIGASFVESIEVEPNQLEGFITELKAMGLEEVNGKPIEEIVVARKKPQGEHVPNLSIPHDEPTAEQIALEQELAEKQATIQAIISGEKSYTSFNEIAELAVVADDVENAFKSMVQSIINQGKKEQLTSDLKEYLKQTMKPEELQEAASGQAPDAETAALFSFIHDTIGIDYGALYDEVSSQTIPSPDAPPMSEPPLTDDWL